MITAPETAELFVFFICLYVGMEHGVPWVTDRWHVWRGKAAVRDWRTGA